MKAEFGRMEIFENYSLKSLNTFGVEARAKYFVQLRNEQDAKELAKTDLLRKHPYFILGGGSNVLFRDYFEGVIIQLENKGIEVAKEKNKGVKVRCAAGEGWHSFVEFCVRNDLGGLENLSLIPGKAGAAPIQNIGAYGVEQQDAFKELTAIDLMRGKLRKFKSRDCEFGYRNSYFKKNPRNPYLILNVSYQLSKEHKYNLSYGALQEHVAGKKHHDLSLQLISDLIVDIRKSKLPDPDMLGNAGSFFKNPVISAEQFRRLKSKYPEMAAYKLNERQYKIAAGWLIDKLGWKGKRKGDAGVHEKQALVIVNYGSASGEEIFNFSEGIRKDVMQHFDIGLEREVILI